MWVGNHGLSRGTSRFSPLSRVPFAWRRRHSRDRTRASCNGRRPRNCGGRSDCKHRIQELRILLAFLELAASRNLGSTWRQASLDHPVRVEVVELPLGQQQQVAGLALPELVIQLDSTFERSQSLGLPFQHVVALQSLWVDYLVRRSQPS